MTTRAQLEAIRARGGRLVAEDHEALDEAERYDAFFCDSCGCYFAYLTDPPDIAAKKSAAHFQGGLHDRP